MYYQRVKLSRATLALVKVTRKTILRAVPPRHPVNQITQLSSAPLPDLAYADRPCEHERWRWLLGGGLTFSFLFSGRRTTFLYDQLYSQHSKVLDAP